MSEIPNLQVIQEAHDRITPFIHRTPILTSQSINKLTGAEIYFKCENFQKVGAFKARGGLNAVLSLNKEDSIKGVATHSSGNHAQAIALAASMAEIPAYIVMPSNAPEVKKAAVKGYGAEITECEPTLKARETNVERIVSEKGSNMIHPYNDYRIVAGQATAAKELIEDVNLTLDSLLTPVGGGGLLSGSALSAHYLSPETRVIGTEPEGADDAYQSFKSGTLIPQLKPNTIADGLLTSLGELNFEIIKKHVDDILLANDEEIINAMRLIWERMKIIIEPSCAVPLAALMRSPDRFQGMKVGIILTGGNVDLAKLPFT
ncbi:MAG: pyridoxal-phosphate dependent enzyme [Bacteroidota bacterium]